MRRCFLYTTILSLVDITATKTLSTGILTEFLMRCFFYTTIPSLADVTATKTLRLGIIIDILTKSELLLTRLLLVLLSTTGQKALS